MAVTYVWCTGEHVPAAIVGPSTHGDGFFHVKYMSRGGGGATPRFWTPTTPPQLTIGRRPLGGGGGGGGGGLEGGSRRGGGGGGCSGRVGGGGSKWGNLGWWWGGGVQVGRFGVLRGGGGAQAPLTSPCPPSHHTITINLTLTFAAS